MRISRITAGIVGASLALAISGPGICAMADTSNDSRVSNTEIVQALTRVADLTAPPASVVPEGVEVRPEGTLTFSTADAGDIIVSLPHANEREKGRATNHGVAYAGTNGSGTFVASTAEGVQTLLVIENASAPTDYPFGVQNGSAMELSGGGVLLLDALDRPARIIPAPWARDARGNWVTTRFTVSSNGEAFGQTVAHLTDDVVYPVVADPHYKAYPTGVVVTLSKWETGVIAASSAFTAVSIVAAALSGRLFNKVNINIWHLQLAAAWHAANGRCLWVWVPFKGDIETGGRRC